MTSCHESEWVYSTALTRRLKLTALNEAIHSIHSVSHPAELFIFACGYAFNPVMIPLWLSLIHLLTPQYTQNHVTSTKLVDTLTWIITGIRNYGPSHLNNIRDAPLINTALYLVSVLITLLFTELAKSSFATTRPASPMIVDNTNKNGNTKTNSQNIKWIRRYGALVSSLKSKHSFPSGDCAQAMNLCLFLHRFIPAPEKSMRDTLLFGVFLPGVAFARVFYWCHWIEDCIGGVALSYLLHWSLKQLETNW